MDNCDYYVLILFNIKMPRLGNNTDPEWLDYRLEIFRYYTLRSLLNQVDGHFRIWMACLEESEDILMPKIEAVRKKDPMMDIVDFVFDEKVACDRLADNTEPLYFLKLDSDDMYRKDTIKRTRDLLGHSDEISLAMFCNGFIYDIKTARLHIFSRWSITTYAVFYPSRTFDHNSFRKYCICDQTKVRERFNPIIDTNKMVCCLDHDMNLHNNPRREGVEAGRRTGQKEYANQSEAPSLLKEFGVEQ